RRQRPSRGRIRECAPPRFQVMRASHCSHGRGGSMRATGLLPLLTLLAGAACMDKDPSSLVSPPTQPSRQARTPRDTVGLNILAAANRWLVGRRDVGLLGVL